MDSRGADRHNKPLRLRALTLADGGLLRSKRDLLAAPVLAGGTRIGFGSTFPGMPRSTAFITLSLRSFE